MASKPLRNPGCEYCVYRKSYFDKEKNKTKVFCVQKAKISVSPKRKKWRWINCENVEVKNKRNYCQEYKRFGFFLLKQKLLEYRFNKKWLMECPALAGDKFWKT